MQFLLPGAPTNRFNYTDQPTNLYTYTTLERASTHVSLRGNIGIQKALAELLAGGSGTATIKLTVSVL